MTKRMVISALALAGVFVALYLTLYKLGTIGVLTCSIGGCERVNTSRWATFLGAPVALWGVMYYVGMFVLSFVGTMPRFEGRRDVSVALVTAALVGVVFSAWLTYLELFVIHAICQYCVISATLVTSIFVVSLVDLRTARGRGLGRIVTDGS